MLHFDEIKENKEYELIEKNEYEVSLAAEFKEYNGNTYINCTFQIRKDVDQKYGGRLVFDAIYKQKNSNDFSPSKISGILGAIPQAKRDFEDYDELIQYLNGKNMIVTIDIQPAENGYKAKNIVKYLSYKPSQHATKIEEVTDEDLPF